MEVLLTEPGSFKHKVSSTLNGSAEFASKHMFDDSVDNCWNSGSGPQFVLIDFQRTVNISNVQIAFQGGFAGQDGLIEAGTSLGEMETLRELPDIRDSNDIQDFRIPNGGDLKPVRYLRIAFRQSTDFYGRVTIYSLKVFGKNV